MAHSNRKKLKDARGGLTRNQLRKAKHVNLSKSSNRLQETISWLAQLEEKKRIKSPTASVNTKVIRFSRTVKANRRRKIVLPRLESQLLAGTKLLNYKYLLKVTEEQYQKDDYTKQLPLTDQNKDRIKNEIGILKARIY